MKQLTILLLLSLSMKSQVISVTPTRICSGDTLYVHYQSLTPNNQFNLVTPDINQAWTVSDSTGFIKLKTTLWLPMGEAKFSIDFINTFSIFVECGILGVEEQELNQQAKYFDLYGPVKIKRIGNTYTKVICIKE